MNALSLFLSRDDLLTGCSKASTTTNLLFFFVSMQDESFLKPRWRRVDIVQVYSKRENNVDYDDLADGSIVRIRDDLR